MSDVFAPFGCAFPPFSKEIPDSELWLPSPRVEVVDALVSALEQRQSALLVGESGVGKTCILRALRHRLPKDSFRLTYAHNATLGRHDFYRQLCQTLGLAPKSTAGALFFALGAHVQELSSARIHPVLILDEAQLLHNDVLGHLHILLNYEWDSRALLSIVLVGLPELRERFSLSCHRPLYSRLHTRLAIEPATLADPLEYLGYRLKRAGTDREVFSADAYALLHEASAGLHRELDRLCTHALRLASTSRQKLVEREHVAAVISR